MVKFLSVLNLSAAFVMVNYKVLQDLLGPSETGLNLIVKLQKLPDPTFPTKKLNSTFLQWTNLSIIFAFPTARYPCGWRRLPGRSSSSGNCTSAKWWGWRSVGSTAPLWGSSTLACQSEWDNIDMISVSWTVLEFWCVCCVTVGMSVLQWYQQDQRCHCGSSCHLSATLHHLCVWFLRWLCERMEVNACHCRSKSTDRHWNWSYGSGETLISLNLTSLDWPDIISVDLTSPPLTWLYFPWLLLTRLYFSWLCSADLLIDLPRLDVTYWLDFSWLGLLTSLDLLALCDLFV